MSLSCAKDIRNDYLSSREKDPFHEQLLILLKYQMASVHSGDTKEKHIQKIHVGMICLE
jgi:hypothetical protein